jgi:hypothetical protein
MNMVLNNSSLLTATKPIITGGKNNSVELLYPSTKSEETINNPKMCVDDDQQIGNESDNTDIKGLPNDNSSDDQKEDMMLEKCENTINNKDSSDNRDENNCNDDGDDDDDDGESKNDELTLEQKIQGAKVTIRGGALVILGIFLAPIPILPLGIHNIGVGLHVLSSEYEEARNAEQKLLEGITCGRAKLLEEYDKHHCQLEKLMQERRGELSEQGVLIQRAITKSNEQLNITWGRATLLEEYDKHQCQIETLMQERRGELSEQGVLIQQAITRSKEQLRFDHN